jgi:hypothetical protein
MSASHKEDQSDKKRSNLHQTRDFRRQIVSLNCTVQAKTRRTSKDICKLFLFWKHSKCIKILKMRMLLASVNFNFNNNSCQFWFEIVQNSLSLRNNRQKVTTRIHVYVIYNLFIFLPCTTSSYNYFNRTANLLLKFSRNEIKHVIIDKNFILITPTNPAIYFQKIPITVMNNVLNKF